MSFKDLAKLINNASKDKTPAEEFLEKLHRAQTMLEKQHREKRPPSDKFSPSSIGGCMRQLAFKVTRAPLDEEQKISPDLISIGESGTDRHDRIQAVISKMEGLGLGVEWVDVGDYLSDNPVEGTEVIGREGLETKLYNSVINANFRCDGVIKMKGNYYILEIKTETSFKFMQRFSPEPKHIVQASCYAACIGIPDVIFLYENRDLCNKKPFLVHVTDEMIQENVIGIVETVNSSIESSLLPEVTSEKKECNYCRYTEHCKRFDKGETPYDYKKWRDG